MNKKVLLVGFGSEIGSMLLAINDSKKSKIDIKTVITNRIYSKNYNPLESLYARLVLNNPSLEGQIKLDFKKNEIKIGNSKTKVIFADIKKFNLSKIKEKYDSTIVATSKKHISDKKLMKKFLKVSKYVFGVAEALNLPAVYPCLINSNNKFFEKKQENIKNNKIFALGSCQSNGWMSHLRIVNEVAIKLCKKFNFLNFEVDIVHPDTPTGSLGTKSIDPREQDARNNFRPGFSQVKKSIERIFPKAESTHTVALRTLISPPGYMISRFFFSYQSKSIKKLKLNDFQNIFEKFEKKFPNIVKLSKLPLGSKAFEMSKSSSVILSSKDYLIFKDDFLNKKNKNEKVSELIIQSYVHNTRGYCFSVLNALKNFLNTKSKKAFF